MNTTHRNALNWFEIAVTDITKAAAFYGNVTGAKLEVMSFGGRPHAVFGAGASGAPTDGGVHGALVETDQAIHKPSAGGTVIYLDIADGVQRALDRAREAGGKIVQPLTDLGEHGTCALIEDRDGNLVGLHTAKA
jgi:hypothetical protein